MKTLIVLNDPPYGTERTYNGLRLALGLLQKSEGRELTVFLMGDAVGSGKAGFGAGDFYGEPRPAVKVRRPSRLWHAGKVLLEKQILWQWL